MERDISCALAVLHWQVLQFYTQPKAGAHRDEEEVALREAAVAFCSSAAEGQPLVVAVRLTGGGAARYLVRPTAKAAPTGKGKGRGAKGKRVKGKGPRQLLVAIAIVLAVVLMMGVQVSCISTTVPLLCMRSGTSQIHLNQASTPSASGTLLSLAISWCQWKSLDGRSCLRARAASCCQSHP